MSRSRVSPNLLPVEEPYRKDISYLEDYLRMKTCTDQRTFIAGILFVTTGEATV
jgi:hypothetical protein